MLAYTYEYDGKRYNLYGYNLEEARRNAVLEAFFRFYEGNPKITVKVQEGTNYSAIDPVRPRGPKLFEYAQMDVDEFDEDARPLMAVVKHAYDSTSLPHPFREPEPEAPRSPRIRRLTEIILDREQERQEIQKTYRKKKGGRRCAGFLSGRNCDIAETAQTRDPLLILRFGKEEYETLASWYCSISNLPVIDEVDRFKKIRGHKAVNIKGVRHVWQDREETETSSSYRAQAYCMAIKSAIKNYDKYLDMERSINDGTYRMKYGYKNY